MAARLYIHSQWSRYGFSILSIIKTKKSDFSYRRSAAKFPFEIKNVQNPRGGGTVIHPDPESDVPSDSSTALPVPEPATLKSFAIY